MLAFELVKELETKEPATDEAKALVKFCYKPRLILLSCGNFGNVIRVFMPPFITDEKLEREVYPSWRMGSLSFQNDMDPGNNPISSIFLEIKRNIDLSLPYMVFEKEVGSSEGGVLSEIIQILSILKMRYLGRQIYRDESSGRVLLVV
jgi:hypothetical protein